MPTVAIGAGFAVIGGWAATGAATIAGGIFIGSAIGALGGAAVALVTGKDPVKGALMGAISGGVAGGIGQSMGAAKTAVAGTEVAAPKVADAGMSAAGGIDASVNAGLAAPTATGAAGTATTTAPAAAAPKSSGGLLSGVSNWINKNPMPAAMIAQGVGGAAAGIAEERASEKEIDALMKRDRLNIASQQIVGIADLDLKTALPSIGTFTERPTWAMPNAGLISEMQGGSKNANAK